MLSRRHGPTFATNTQALPGRFMRGALPVLRPRKATCPLIIPDYKYTLFMLKAEIIPQNVSGKENDLHASVKHPNEAAAIKCFETARRRMLTPARWAELCGGLSARFELTDQHGTTLHRPANQNDLIRIDIPGPGPATGHGFDWVKVEAIEERPAIHGAELCAMRVRPSRAPGSKGVAHFFSGEATSTFVIRRSGVEVEASYHGRNEMANTATKKAGEKLRNAAVAAGAMAGISELQWQALIEAFVS